MSVPYASSLLVHAIIAFVWMKKAVSQFRIDDVETLAWLGQITMSYMLAAFAELRAGCSLVRALVSRYLAPMQIEVGTQGGARTGCGLLPGSFPGPYLSSRLNPASILKASQP